jgi:general L-amino acid transport system permease protein
VAVALIAFGVWFLAHNTLANMQARGIKSGFDFLVQPAGFDIGETLVPYQALDPYWKAFLVGVLNTLRAAIVGIVLATVLGTLLGIGRFSRNAILRGLCYGYVELFRNVPVLIQLLMWYLFFTDWLPALHEASSLGGAFYLSKAGFSFPVPVWAVGHALAGAGFVLGIAAAWGYRRWAMRRFEATGRVRSLVLAPIGIVFALAAAREPAGGRPPSGACRSPRAS